MQDVTEILRYALDDKILNRLFLIHTRKVRPYQFLQLFGHYTYLPSFQM